MVDFQKKGLDEKVFVVCEKAPYFSEALGCTLLSLLVNPALDILISLALLRISFCLTVLKNS